ncbi:MAG: hypothetical protein QOH56_395 [Pseudonocardiales bacterium]|jgi:hypothetical protein|nr:hypothetical protein [Pseudonocardiales bacterium]
MTDITPDSWHEADFAFAVEATVEVLRAEAAEIAMEDQLAGSLLGRLANAYAAQALELGQEFLYR